MLSSIRRNAGNLLYETEHIRNVYNIYKRTWATATAKYPIGTNIYQREWDLLIVLDTCRIDALRAVSDEYDFLTDIGGLTSVGSCSPEWIANTFRTEYRRDVQQTACITANAYMQRIIEDREYMGGTDHVVAAEDFALLNQPWRYVPDDVKPFVHTPPNYITDRTIDVVRSMDPDRVLAHYTPPHSPYTANAIAEGRDLKPHEKNPFEALRDGVPFEIVWEAYLDELRCALAEVKVLLNNVDADTVIITADHGEAFGEFGIYSHPLGMIHPKIKRVPWAVTTATDSGSYTPDLTYHPESDEVSRDAKEHLKDLGYF